MAKQHLEQTEVILDLIQCSLEGAAGNLVRAGYVSQGGDEAACQVAGVVPTNRAAAHWTLLLTKSSI